MTAVNQVRVLFFDVYGTCVQQRKPVADELSKAFAALSKLSYEDWDRLGNDWNSDVEEFTANMKKSGKMNWKSVDEYRPESLRKLLEQHGLRDVEESQLEEVSRVWQRLTPWPDTIDGLTQLKKKYTTVSLSNCYQKSLESLVAHNGLPFSHIYSADMFGSYKPDPKVYLGGAEKIGVKPEECALVAAHLSDLKGAKACGFRAIYAQRPQEEKDPALRDEGIPDLVINEAEGGLSALAKLLGIADN